jgi:hypothetical protein
MALGSVLLGTPGLTGALRVVPTLISPTSAPVAPVLRARAGDITTGATSSGFADTHRQATVAGRGTSVRIGGGRTSGEVLSG